MKINIAQNKGDPVKNEVGFMIIGGLSVLMVLLGFLADTPKGILNGLKAILMEPGTLVTDYIGVGGLGATLVNAGVLTLIFCIMLYKLKIKFNGASYASLFLIAGFAFFGKNLVNVWFIVIGVYLYARYQKVQFSRYIYIALFGTAMAPMVSELFFSSDGQWLTRIALGAGTGILIGFILPSLSAYLMRVHQGFNLYNIGFASGIIGTVFVSVYKSYGFTTTPKMIWTTGNNGLIAPWLYGLSIVLILIGIKFDKNVFGGFRNVIKHHGRLVTDFTLLEGHAPSLFNMGVNGILATSYILFINGDLNGPTIGGIFTVIGFGAFGKHAKNILPIWIGVSIGAFTKLWGINDPGVQLAALFGTGLAPIAGEYGWKFGILAGFIHSSVVLNVGVLHGGINLYNNGFAAGLVAAFLIPAIDAIRKDEA